MASADGPSFSALHTRSLLRMRARLELALENWVEHQHDWFEHKVEIESENLEQMVPHFARIISRVEIFGASIISPGHQVLLHCSFSARAARK